MICKTCNNTGYLPPFEDEAYNDDGKGPFKIKVRKLCLDCDRGVPYAVKLIKKTIYNELGAKAYFEIFKKRS